jgi:hypothetical protein
VTMESEKRENDWFTPQELALRWKISALTVTRLCLSKQLVGRKIGGQWRVHKLAVERYEAKAIPKASTRKLDMREFDEVEQHV